MKQNKRNVVIGSDHQCGKHVALVGLTNAINVQLTSLCRELLIEKKKNSISVCMTEGARVAPPSKLRRSWRQVGPWSSHFNFVDFFFFAVVSDNNWVIGIASPKVLGIHWASFS